MLEDIETKKINLIITKDLSRLGRNYIEVGYYLEIYFPHRKVRYIAINDGIDTFLDNSSNDMTPFKAVMNDMYSKDISKKVRSAMIAIAKKGKSIKAFPPYGYQKHPTEKGQLIVDENTAPVVKKIFEMYYSGICKTDIARELQLQDIPTPLKYKETTCSYKNPNQRKEYIWNTTSISKILRDQIYIGDLVQHKYAKLNYKNKKTINLNKEAYIIAENCHEPIVSKELFYSVQEMLDMKSNEYNYIKGSIPHLLRGLVFCGKCHTPVTYTKNHGKNFFAICSTYKKFGKSYCNNVYLREDYLIDTVLSCLKETIKKYVNQNDLNIPHFPQKDNSKQIIFIYRKLKESEKYLISIYKDKVDEKISDDLFQTISSNIAKEKKQLENKLATLNAPSNSKPNDEKEIRKFIHQALTLENKKNYRNLLLKLINKIEIDNKNELKIYYNFKNPCEL